MTDDAQRLLHRKPLWPHNNGLLLLRCRLGVFSRMVKKKQRVKKPRLSTDITAEEFAELGADFFNRVPGGNQRDFDGRWQAHFCAEPEVCADVWRRLEVDNIDLDAPDDKIAEPCHLLWALLLLKTYETESVLAGLCGGVDEDTFRKWAWHFIEKVSYLEHEVVSVYFYSPMIASKLLSVLFLSHSRHADHLREPKEK
jgi:hypothetical protein